MNQYEKLVARLKKAQDKRDIEQLQYKKEMLKQARNITKSWNAWCYLLERELKK